MDLMLKIEFFYIILIQLILNKMPPTRTRSSKQTSDNLPTRVPPKYLNEHKIHVSRISSMNNLSTHFVDFIH